jgi:EAL domain-containing protein (putative c-di-GMP-specific phosphodiesterase class I)
MRQNEVYRVKDEDYEKFNKHRYIVEQLEDIYKKRDLLDPRVTVFCQPVYNVITGKYDSAEALMRLTLKDTGMVFPDQFIPIAEKHNYIHTLSMIILSKTCHEIKEFIDNGYEFNRISVNFSILDFREKDFCDSVIKIINDAGIPFDKVAMEVTESQNEKDFKAIRDIFSILKNTGITLYLDDFGTGYSSFERIVEIPFDIIKFDRSLVIASGEQVKAETTVSYLAHMFTDLNYSVLYEGIEDENDENRCVNMYARYLQGYKYSKPIPIGRLAEFFEKKEEAVGTT